MISGVVKGGTTSLFTYLSWNPDICSSSIKETRYFQPLRYGKELPPIDEYTRYFCHFRGQKYIMEASPQYFLGGRELAQAIYEKLGLIKIIIVFRDPIDRLFSFYKHFKKGMKIPKSMSFDEYISLSEKTLKSFGISI